MKPLAIAVVCLTALQGLSVPGAAQEKRLITEVAIYRIRTFVSGDRSFSGSATFSEVRGRGTLGKLPVELFFSSAELTIAGVKFKADENRWTWNGKEDPPKDAGIELLSRPKLASNMGQPLTLWTGSEEPIQYLERLPDGLFALKTCDEPLGVRLDITIDEGEPGPIVLNLKISASFSSRRLSIEGVTLDVGAPIIDKRAYQTTVSVEPGRYYGLIYPAGSEKQGGLLIRMRVDVESPR